MDTDGDSVKCVKQELLPKTSPEESGTAVSLLVPVSTTDEICCGIISISNKCLVFYRAERLLLVRGLVWQNTLLDFNLVLVSNVDWKYWLRRCQPFLCLFDQRLNGALNNKVSRASRRPMTWLRMKRGPMV